MPDKFKIDIRSLYQLPLENLYLDIESNKLSETEIHRCFKKTDLNPAYDKKTREFTLETKLDRNRTTLKNEIKKISRLRSADAKGPDGKGDGWLDTQEVQNFGVQRPRKFLEKIDEKIKTRYQPLAACIQELDGVGQARPLMDLLRTYNEGIYQDEVRHAYAVLPLNGLTKSAVNIVSFPVVGLHNLFSSDENDWDMGGTYFAKKSAKEDFERANQALDNLEAVFLEGLQSNEDWAKKADLKEAMKRLNPEDQEIISDRLAGDKIFEILSISNPAQKYQAMDRFAEDERPYLLGYGGGNSSHWSNMSFWNYTGRKNNIYFAKSLYEFLSKKANTGDKTTDDQIHKNAQIQRASIVGDPLAGFNNSLWASLTRVPTLNGTLGKPTPYRPWSDLDEMNGLGRLLDFGILVWGGHQLLKGGKEAQNLRSVHGTGEVFRVWRRNFSLKELLKLKPLPTQAFAEAAKVEPLAVAEYSRLDRALTRGLEFLNWPLKQLARPLHWTGEKLLSYLPLSPKIEATVSQGINTADSWLTHGFLLLGGTYWGDQAITGPTTPTDMGFKSDSNKKLNAHPSPLRQEFDPQLYPDGIPQYDPVLFKEHAPKN